MTKTRRECSDGSLPALSEYVLMAGVATDRLSELRRERPFIQPQEASSMSRLAKILCIASVLRIRPRVIDRYIDYFGGRTS